MASIDWQEIDSSCREKLREDKQYREMNVLTGSSGMKKAQSEWNDREGRNTGCEKEVETDKGWGEVMEFPEVCIWKRAPRYRFTSAWGRMIFRRWRQIMLGSCSLSLCTTPTEMKGSEMLSVYTGQRIFSHTRAYTHAFAHAHTDRHTNTHAILSFHLFTDTAQTMQTCAFKADFNWSIQE